jgi:hypothetical protein
MATKCVSYKAREYLRSTVWLDIVEVSRTITLVRLSSALRHGCSTSAPLAFGTLIVISCITFKSRISLVEPRGLEPLASAVQSQNPIVAGVRYCSENPVKRRISSEHVSCLFAVVRVGWCTTGVQEVRVGTRLVIDFKR